MVPFVFPFSHPDALFEAFKVDASQYSEHDEAQTAVESDEEEKKEAPSTQT